MRPRLGMALLFVTALGAGACASVSSIQNAGYFSTAQRPGAKVDLSLQGRTIITGGSGSLHVEPWLSEEMSLPISLTAGWPWFAEARLGLRVRTGKIATLGVGASYAPVWSRELSCPWGSGECQISWLHGGGADLELGLGNRWRWFALTWSLRPFFRVISHMGETQAHGLGGAATELSFAFHLTRRFAVTLGLEGCILGPWRGGDTGLPGVFSGGLSVGVYGAI